MKPWFSLERIRTSPDAVEYKVRYHWRKGWWFWCLVYSNTLGVFPTEGLARRRIETFAKYPHVERTRYFDGNGKEETCW